MYECVDCGEKFNESAAKIAESGSGAVLSKTELFSCPECGSTKIKDENGKIQRA